VRERALNTAQAVHPMANQSRGRFINAAQNRPAAGAPFDRRPMRALNNGQRTIGVAQAGSQIRRPNMMAGAGLSRDVAF